MLYFLMKPLEDCPTSGGQFKPGAVHFDLDEPVHALIAVEGSAVVGLVQYLFHRSTTRLNDVCYLQDLFTSPNHRGRGAGMKLIEAVYFAAKTAGSTRVYWHTYADNANGTCAL